MLKMLFIIRGKIGLLIGIISVNKDLVHQSPFWMLDQPAGKAQPNYCIDIKLPDIRGFRHTFRW